MRVASLRVAFFIVAFAACGGDPKGPGDDTGEASSGAATTEAVNGTGSGAPTSSASSTGEAPVCDGSPDDSACTMCNNTNCCAQIMKCQAEPACACMTECVTSVSDISMCTDKCGTSKNFSGLSQCGLLNCASECT